MEGYSSRERMREERREEGWRKVRLLCGHPVFPTWPRTDTSVTYIENEAGSRDKAGLKPFRTLNSSPTHMGEESFHLCARLKKFH